MFQITVLATDIRKKTDNTQKVLAVLSKKIKTEKYNTIEMVGKKIDIKKLIEKISTLVKIDSSIIGEQNKYTMNKLYKDFFKQHNELPSDLDSVENRVVVSEYINTQLNYGNITESQRESLEDLRQAIWDFEEPLFIQEAEKITEWCEEAQEKAAERRPHQILCKKNKALPIRQDLKQRKNLKGSVFNMEKTSKELLKEFVNSQNFTSTADIMNSMKELFSDVLQTVIEVELEEKPGYEKSERVSNTGEENMSKNYRNGYSKKTVKTQLGEVDVKIPRDRNGEYSPQIIEKYNRNADGMEEKILALYACGMSQSDISGQIKNLYDVDISDGLVSKLVDKITPDVTAWQNRPLDAVYPFVFMDAIHYKVKENHQYITKAAYVVLGIQADGRKDILGVWIGENESAKFWLSVMNDLKNRGVKDVYVFCVDGLTGFREAINAAFPKSQIQRCIIHQIRSSTRYVSCKDIKFLMSDLKKVYQAINEDEALNALLEFKEKWQKSYPSCVKSWEENWDILSTFFAYPAEVRKIIYTTNIIEGLNRQFRKITKNKPSFTNDDSLRQILYLASKNIVSHWSVTCRNWDVVSDQLSIMFADRKSA